MTANQLVRRQRLLEAVPQLVADGFDEDMQMKDIAERAGVALGTVYRYFSSKEHLMAAALLYWATGLDRAVTRSVPASGTPLAGTPAERLIDGLHRALRAYRRHPAFARLLVLVANSTDPNASAEYSQMGDVVYGALGHALADVDPDKLQRVMAVIGAVWYHCLVEWTIGRMTADEVDTTLESAAHLVLP
jgi:AcrR family transcriptional regulator